MVPESEAAVRLGIAALIGAAMGAEREWSGHATGPDARFAGLRTFLLLGVSGGIAGLFSDYGNTGIAVVLFAAAALFPLAGYVTASRRSDSDIGATTEVAALAVVALGAVTGTGRVGLAAGAGSLVVLIVRERARLHGLVRLVHEDELRAMLQFAALALIVLPLLPAGPYLGELGVRPRLIWTFVLLLSGLNLIVYLLRRSAGGHAGIILGGLIGGLTSSTAVTLAFSRRSRDDDENATTLAFGVIAACTMLFPRVVAVSAISSPAVASALAVRFALPIAAGAVVTYLAWRGRSAGTNHVPPLPKNPLQLRAALGMALGFQVALSAVGLVQSRWGAGGLYATAALLGITDVDGLTMSFSREEAALPVEIAARAIAIGILVNTAFKLVLSLALGARGYRRVAAAGLIGLAIALVVSLAA